MGRAPTRQGPGRHAHPQGRDPVPGRRSPARPPRRNPGAPPLRRRPAPARGAERQPDSQARDPVFRGQGVVFRARVRRAWRGGRDRLRRLPGAADHGAPARRAGGDGHADPAAPGRSAVRPRVRVQADAGAGEALALEDFLPIHGEVAFTSPPRGEVAPEGAGGAERPRRISIVAEGNGARHGNGSVKGSFKVKAGLAQMLKGGVIMDVVTAEHARIAQEAGACAVMALERVPADIRKEGGVARMSDPELIKSIMAAVTIPVMAKARIGHFVEAQVLEALGIDYIDESEVLTPADEENHIDKWAFKVPFVCGARDLGEALRRIGEGAAMVRTKGEAGTGNVVEAVRHMRAVQGGIRRLGALRSDELMVEAKRLQAPYELVSEIARTGKLPVVNFSAGGIATPADAALMMQLGAEGNFVGSGIFKSEDPLGYAKAIVAATTYFDKPEVVAEVSAGLGHAMRGLDVAGMPKEELLATRGW